MAFDEWHIKSNSSKSVAETIDLIQSHDLSERWNIVACEGIYDKSAVVNFKSEGIGWFRSVVSKNVGMGEAFFKSWCGTKYTVDIEVVAKSMWDDNFQLFELGYLDFAYRFAFEYCNWDTECDVLFLQDSEEVFVKKSGQFLVDPRFFKSQSLTNLLPQDYQTAEQRMDHISDERRLEIFKNRKDVCDGSK